MMNGGMLQGKLCPGSPLKNFTYNSAEPTLVCKVLSPLVGLLPERKEGRKNDKKSAAHLRNGANDRHLEFAPFQQHKAAYAHKIFGHVHMKFAVGNLNAEH